MIADIEHQDWRIYARGPGWIDMERDGTAVDGTATAFDQRGREYQYRLRAAPADRAAVREMYRLLRAWLHGHEVSTADGHTSRLPGSVVWGAA